MKKLLEYRISFLLILIGAAMLASVWTVANKWISGPVGLTGIALIILGLQIASRISDRQMQEQYPDLDAGLELGSLKEKIVHYGGYVAGLSTSVLLMVAGRYFENTIGGTRFALESAAVGVLVAAVFYQLFKLMYSAFFKQNNNRYSSIFMYCLAVLFGTLLLQAHYNVITVKEKKQKTVFVESKTKNISKGTLYVFLNIDGRRERFNPKNSEYKAIQQHDSIVITYGKGKMGYDYVFKFAAPHHVRRIND